MGSASDGIECFQRATKSAPANSKCFFDLGVAYEYTFQFNKAVEYLKKAYQMENKSLYLKELGRCKRLQTEHEQLQKQLQQARS